MNKLLGNYQNDINPLKNHARQTCSVF